MSTVPGFRSAHRGPLSGRRLRCPAFSRCVGSDPSSPTRLAFFRFESRRPAIGPSVTRAAPPSSEVLVCLPLPDHPDFFYLHGASIPSLPSPRNRYSLRRLDPPRVRTAAEFGQVAFRARSRCIFLRAPFLTRCCLVLGDFW